MADIADVDSNDLSEQKNMDHPILSSILDSYFVNLVKGLETDIREQIVEVYSHPKIKVAVVPAELEQKSGESVGEYIKRLKAFLEKQCSEIQVSENIRRNRMREKSAKYLVREGLGGADPPMQEQSKVDKLCARLLELGEDVDKLLEGIGDDVGKVEDGDDEEDTQ